MTEKDSVKEFLDLLENKYAIRIKIEANEIPAPRIRSGLTYRSASLAGIFWEAVELYKKNSMYYHDVRKLVSAIKLHGVYEETEGLPKKYQECFDKCEKLQKAFDDVSEAYETIKKQKEECDNDKKALERELDRIKIGRV